MHSSDNIPVAGGMRESREESASMDQRMNEIPVKEIKLPWTTRLREFVKSAYQAYRQGIADVNKAQPPTVWWKKVLDVLEKILTVTAGIMGLKKI